MIRLRVLFAILAGSRIVLAQAPPLIDLPGALERARQYANVIQSASIATQLAHEDRVQAKAGMLPAVNQFSQFIYTQSNGSDTGVFVANNGPRVWSIQGNVHEDLSLSKRYEYRRSIAAEAVARSKADISARGLTAAVVQDYYALVAAQRRLGNASQALEDAQRFLDISQKLEAGGETAHADVVKALLQSSQRQRDVQDAQLAIDKARIVLAVLIFPDFTQQFSVADDLATAPALPAFTEVGNKAAAKSPEIAAARSALAQESAGVSIARSGYLPSLSLDYFYGLNANQLAVYDELNRKNLGSSAVVSMNLPIWTWGAQQSKVKQASLRQQQARLDLTLTQRQLLANLNAFYREADTANRQIESLGQAVKLSEDSLRLTVLRYQAGEATALEVVDAQTTLLQARNAYVDGLARYRVALGALQTLTGAL